MHFLLSITMSLNMSLVKYSIFLNFTKQLQHVTLSRTKGLETSLTDNSLVINIPMRMNEHWYKLMH